MALQETPARTIQTSAVGAIYRKTTFVRVVGIVVRRVNRLKYIEA